MKDRLTIQDVLSKLSNVKKNGDGFTACCPAHDDKSPSLSIKEAAGGKIVFHCFAGCTFDQICAALNFEPRQLCGADASQPQAVKPRLVKAYDHPDENGALLFQVCRMEPKGFFQRRPDGNGGWINNLNGVRLVLYRLPDVVRAVANGETITIAEGQKDCDALAARGFCSTCNPTGAGKNKWLPEFSAVLDGADVRIIADKDGEDFKNPANSFKGQRHAAAIALSLHGRAKSVRVITLPDRDGRKVKDAHDFFAAGGTADELRALFEAAPIWTPATAQTDMQDDASDGATVNAADSRNKFIILPGGNVSISQSADGAFRLIGPTKKLFYRGGRVMELRRDGDKSYLDVVTPEAFRSRLEKFGKLFVWRAGAEGEPVLKPTTCPQETAGALLATTEAEQFLPHIRGITDCPIIAEIDGKAKVLAQGYHEVNGGILVTHGDAPPDVPFEQARDAILSVFEEFDFQTPSDQSRATASLLTPALKHGDLLHGRVPADTAEADQSQAGKGFRQNLNFATYNARPSVIAQRDGGVGGRDESVQQAMIHGSPFIQIDNLRGPFDSPFIEATMTCDGDIGCRVPHKGEVRVYAPHFMFFLTSNGVETTRDMANRSNIIRIRKRENFAYRKFAEGDLLAHVRAKQSYFLGAVFAVIRQWHSLGKPTTNETRHDFRQWAQTLDWIVQHLLGMAPLLDGHQSAQERVSNPAKTWLRLVALKVHSDGRDGEEISASAIADVCAEHDIELPRLTDESDEARRKRVGCLLSQCFGKNGVTVAVDNFTVEKRTGEKYNEERQGFVPVKSYVFTTTTTEGVST